MACARRVPEQQPQPTFQGIDRVESLVVIGQLPVEAPLERRRSERHAFPGRSFCTDR